MKTDDVATVAQKLGTPVDFDGLVKAGVLLQKGKNRYAILDMKRLPEHASAQVRSWTMSNGKPPVATFSASNKSAQKVYEKLTGKKFTPIG